jgi:hypothetical protein
VTVLKEYDHGHRDVGTQSERAEAGMPVTYRVKWGDGFEYDVTEDELLTDPKFYERPDPPAPRQLSKEYEMRKSAQSPTLRERAESVAGCVVVVFEGLDSDGQQYHLLVPMVRDGGQSILKLQDEFGGALARDQFGNDALKIATAPKTAQSAQPQVGDILYTSWGYDQTNVEFFQVTRVLPASVEVRRIDKKYDETGFMSGNSVPVPDKFVSDFEFGDKALIRRFRAAPGLGYAVRIDDVRSAWLWDGKPKYESHYAKKKEAWLFIPIDEQVKLVLRVDGDIELKEVSRKSLPGYATQFGSVSPFIVTYDAVINGTKAIVSAKGFTETTSDLGAVDTIESAQVKQWLGFKVAQAVGECWYCMGTGECQYCGGIGYGTYTNDPFEEDHDCDDCNGSGLCHHCDGTGEDFEFDGEKKTAQLLWEDMRPGDKFTVRGKGNYLISEFSDEKGNRIIPLADGDILFYMGFESESEYFKIADGREGAWWASDTLGLERTASTKSAYIREEKGKYKVYSEAGKLFGTYDTKAEADERLQQMHQFKEKEGQAQPVLKPLTNPKTAATFEAYEDGGQRRTTGWTTEDEARKSYEQWAAEGGMVSIVRKEDDDINGETIKLLEYSEGGKKTVFPKTAQERTWGKCIACDKEMRPNNMGCFPLAFKDDGTSVARITYGGYGEYVGGACPDCNCAPGTPHHDGCDQEVCPECHGQFAFCECGWTGLGGRLVQGQVDVEVAADQWQEEREALEEDVCLQCMGTGRDPYSIERDDCPFCAGTGEMAQTIEGDQIRYEQDPEDTLPEEDDVTGIM